MSVKTMKQLHQDAKRLLTEAKSIYDKGDEATVEEIQRAHEATESAKSIAADLDKFGDSDANLKGINAIQNALAVFTQVDRPGMGHDGPYVGRDGATLPGGNGYGRNEVKSIGQTLVSNPDFRDWLKTIAGTEGSILDRAIQSPTVEVKTLLTSGIDHTANRPMLGQADRRPELVRLGWTPLVLRNLVTSIPTTTDLIEVTREVSRQNNAATVAEATSTSGSSGTLPESAVAYEIINVAVQSVGHWIPVTARMLSDARRLAAEIDAFLNAGVDEAAEDIALNGNGTGTDWTGINNTSGILTQAYDTSVLKTTRKARTALKVTGRVMPTAWLMHPSDWEEIDLIQDGQQRYYFGGPLDMGTPRLWGTPVVESEFQTEGAPLLARWSDAVYYDRESTAVSVGNQHMDFFIRRLVAVLAEARMAFHVRRPKSFISVDITA